MRAKSLSTWLCAGALTALPMAASAQPGPAGAPAPKPAPKPAPAAAAPAAQPAAQPAAAATDQPKLQKRELPDRPGPALKVLSPVAGGLTADQVARRTVASSATVRAKQAQLEAAEDKANETMYQFFPKLTFRASYTRLSPVSSGFGSGALVGAVNAGPLGVGPCAPGAPQTCVLDSGGTPVGAAKFDIKFLENNYALSADLNVPISDYILRLSHAAAASSASRRAAKLGVRAEKLKVQNDGRVLFYNWLRAKGQVAVAEKSLEQVQARQKDAKTAYSLGAISKADLMRLEALVANTELMVKQAETLQQLTDAQLGIYMGDKTPRKYTIGEDVLAPAAKPVNGTLPALERSALRRRLEIRVLDATAKALHRGSSAQAVGKLPRLDAFGNVTYANPNQRYFPPQQRWDATWSVGIAATWTVGDTFVNSAAASELEAQARGVEAQRKALADGIRQEVTADYLQREKAKVAVRTSKRAVAAAAEAYRVATDLYRVGRATTTELIDAESDLLQARLGQLNARIDLKVADVKLRHAIGQDVR